MLPSSDYPKSETEDTASTSPDNSKEDTHTSPSSLQDSKDGDPSSSMTEDQELLELPTEDTSLSETNSVSDLEREETPLSDHTEEELPQIRESSRPEDTSEAETAALLHTDGELDRTVS